MNSSYSLRNFLYEATGASVSAVGAITARQEELEFWLRQTGTVVAIIAGLLTILSCVKNLRKKAV